jgi:hypothetical protein
VEKGDNRKKKAKLERQETTASERARNMVSWSQDDPENPKNWSNKRKWAAVLVVSSFTFISPVSSSMVAPALPAMAADLHVTDSVLSQMMLSIFILAYALGPLFLGPLSEVYGRVPVLQLANLFFLIFNLVCGFARTGAQMLVFRFLAGLGGSAPLAIGGGILADCFNPEQRGRAIGIYSLAPLIGPAAGPIAGGFITERSVSNLEKSLPKTDANVPAVSALEHTVAVLPSEQFSFHHFKFASLKDDELTIIQTQHGVGCFGLSV